MRGGFTGCWGDWKGEDFSPSKIFRDKVDKFATFRELNGYSSVIFAERWSVATHCQRTRGAVPVLGDSETNTFCEVVNYNLGPGLRIRRVGRRAHWKNGLPVRFVTILIKLKPSYLVTRTTESWGMSCAMHARGKLCEVGAIKANEIYL